MKKFVIRKRGNYVQRTCRIEEEILDKIDQIVLDYNLQSANSFINDALVKNLRSPFLPVSFQEERTLNSG